MKLIEETFRQILENHIKEDNDWLHGITGYEGRGKSTLGWRICKLIDPNFSVKNVVFTPEDFFDSVDKAQPYTAILVDEGSEVFFSLNTTSRMGRKLTQMMTQIRSKNLFICVIIPDITLLQRYIKAHRMLSLTKVIKRGVCAFYSKRKLSQIFTDKSKKTVYPKPNWMDSYHKVDGKDWEAYNKHKNNFLQKRGKESKKVKFQKRKYEKKIANSFTIREIAEIWGKKKGTVNNYVCKTELFPKKYIFKDISGHIRIKKKGVEIGQKRLLDIHNRGKKLKMKK